MTAYYSNHKSDDGIPDPVDTQNQSAIWSKTVISKSKFNDFGYGVMRF